MNLMIANQIGRKRRKEENPEEENWPDWISYYSDLIENVFFIFIFPLFLRLYEKVICKRIMRL